LPNAVVIIAERRVVNGQSTLASVGGAVSGNGQTDERGVYRIYGLPPGEYVVAAAQSMFSRPAARLTTDADVRWAADPQGSQPRPAAPVIYATTFYPGTTDSTAAATITVASGEERSGVDIAFQWMPTASISGIVTRADGEAIRSVQVHTFRDDAAGTQNLGLGPLMSLLRPTVAADGKFTVTGLAPGPYTLIARSASEAPNRGAPPAPGGPRPMVNDLWAETKLVVSGSDVSNLALVLQPGMTLGGRVQFESASATVPDASRVSINFSPSSTTTVSIGIPSMQAKADGTFSAGGAAPGQYFVSATAPGTTGPAPTWYLKSVTAGGRDVLDHPLVVEPQRDVTDLVVTFSDRVSEVNGRIVDGAGEPAAQFYVGIVPADRAQWRRGSRGLRSPIRPASDGQFRIAGLPPGDYFLTALTAFDVNEWYTAPFLEEAVAGAIRIVLGEGEKKTQDVRLAAVTAP
jgi:hypothetical protein